MPKQMRDSAPKLLVLGVLLGMTAGCLADDAARVARAGSDEALSTGRVLGDDATRVAPRRGDELRSRIRTLSEDEDVQEATYGLSWDVMCDVVTSSLPESSADIAGYVMTNAASFGLQFTDEAAQELGDAILDEIGGDESALREECGQLQP